jgi:hypothetical protein
MSVNFKDRENILQINSDFDYSKLPRPRKKKKLFSLSNIKVTVVKGSDLIFFEDGFKILNDYQVEVTMFNKVESTSIWSSKESPTWNETFHFENFMNKREESFLKIEVFDIDDILNLKNTLGVGTLFVEPNTSNEESCLKKDGNFGEKISFEEEKWVNLKNVKSGKVLLKIMMDIEILERKSFNDKNRSTNYSSIKESIGTNKNLLYVIN